MTHSVRTPGLALLLLCLAATPALARHHHRHDDSATGTGVAGQFDYYLLSLSWSPTYCLTHGTDQQQCGSKGYGFVLHGLWPQYAGGGYPENCATDLPLDEAARRVGETLYPSPKLLSHEWQRHGSCSGLDALAYFRTADRALAAVQVPAVLETPRQPLALTVAQVRAAFRAANARLGDEGMSVACNRTELSEVRVCLSRELKPMACGRGVRDSCPAGALQIPATR